MELFLKVDYTLPGVLVVPAVSVPSVVLKNALAPLQLEAQLTQGFLFKLLPGLRGGEEERIPVRALQNGCRPVTHKRRAHPTIDGVRT